MKILVTGVGGGVGQGIIKCLKMIGDIDVKIIAADISELAAGLFVSDVSYLVDRFDSDKYLKTLGKIFKNEAIDFYIPGTDVELKLCAINKQYMIDKYNVHTIVSSIDTIDISNNKYKTANFLKNNGFNYPKTSYLKEIDINLIDYPVIIKPAVGFRSIGVYKVNNINELSTHLKSSDDILIQECVGDENSEYTCTVVKNRNNLSPVLIFKRSLRSGDTYRAEPVKSKKIENYVLDVASKLEIDGGCNFQLRLDDRGEPKIFEINSRFSGTTPFCAQIGFNPVEYYLKKSLGLETKINIDYNSTLLRYWSEIVVKKSEIKKLSSKKSIKPNQAKQFKLFS